MTPLPRILPLLCLPAGACAPGAREPARAARPPGVVAVVVSDTGGATVGGRAAAGGYRVALEAPGGPVPVGAVRWLEAVVTDPQGGRVADAAVLWESSDTLVVTVPRVGRALAPATGRGPGRATVTASVGRAAASVEVRVGGAAAAAASGPALVGARGAARVVVEPARLEARVGDRVALRAVALGPAGDTLRSCPLRWSTAGAPAAPDGGAPPGGATAVYRVLAAGPVLVTAACDGARGTAVVVVR